MDRGRRYFNKRSKMEGGKMKSWNGLCEGKIEGVLRKLSNIKEERGGVDSWR